MNEKTRKIVVYAVAAVGLVWAAANYESKEEVATEYNTIERAAVKPGTTPANNTTLINVSVEESRPWGDDPFRRWKKKAITHRKPTRFATTKPIKVNGILFNENNPMAYINGRTSRIGDNIEGAEIISIRRKSVMFERDGKRFTVSINKG